jgi:hypothetical protein
MARGWDFPPNPSLLLPPNNIPVKDIPDNVKKIYVNYLAKIRNIE